MFYVFSLLNVLDAGDKYRDKESSGRDRYELKEPHKYECILTIMIAKKEKY